MLFREFSSRKSGLILRWEGAKYFIADRIRGRNVCLWRQKLRAMVHASYLSRGHSCIGHHKPRPV